MISCLKVLITNVLFFLLLLISINIQAQPKVDLPAGVPRNVIIIVGQGMGLGHLTAAELKNNDTLSLEKFPVVGLMKTWSANQIVADPFAGMTAIACGKKTNNGYIGIGHDDKPVENIIEIARKKEMSTGLVTTSSITKTALLPFLIHEEALPSDEKVALKIANTSLDILIAGGNQYFTKRSDNQNLVSTFKSRQYIYEDNLKRVGKLRGTKFVALVAEDDVPAGKYSKAFLPKGASNAAQMMLANPKGYFLVVENSHIKNAIVMNAPLAMADEVIELDNTVKEVLKLAGQNTLILVMGNVEFGGINITGGSQKDKKTEINTSFKNNTATMVPVFAFGPGAEQFSGIYDNTDVFNKLLKFINVKR